MSDDEESGAGVLERSTDKIDPSTMRSALFGTPIFLRGRELNVYPPKFRFDSNSKEIMYRKMAMIDVFPKNDGETGWSNFQAHRGIFGINFSPDGSIVSVACQEKTIFLMDPLSRKKIRTVDNAHLDCVNNVKFLDNRYFASCSDDQTVKLWDVRFLNQSLRVLSGHTSWVKNIEYVQQHGVLLTSGFDNVVHAWEINKYNENQDNSFTRLLNMPGLIRMRLTDDGSKMIISTQWGYIFVVHNFDVLTCGKDLANIKPNVCWLMMKSEISAPESSRKMYVRQCIAPRNRIELIMDFPDEFEAKNITSITPHPYGWCVLSRNIIDSDHEEWSCVHDIQLPTVDELVKENWDDGECASFSENVASTSSANGTSEFEINSDAFDDEISARAMRHRYGSGYMSIRYPRARQTARMSTGGWYRSGRMCVRLPIPVTLKSVGWRFLGSASESSLTPKVHRRLTHYIEEPTSGKGFIKEQSFSSDGRIIASPFGYGVRLLAFDDKCSELNQASPLRAYERSMIQMLPSTFHGRETRSQAKRKEEEKKAIRQTAMADMESDGKAVPLKEIRFHKAHDAAVLCAQFSPTHCLLMTGCLDGKVAFYEPVL